MKHSPEFLKLVAEAQTRVQEIRVDQARNWLKDHPNAMLVDVREESEWKSGHAEDAVHLGKGIFERDIEARCPNPQTPLLLYCGGGFRSILTCDAAQKMGYGNIFSLAGGFKAMKEAGWPLQSDGQ